MHDPTMTYVTVAEAARLAGLSHSQIRRLAASRQLQAHRLGRDWRIDPGSALAYASSDRRPGRKPK